MQKVEKFIQIAVSQLGVKEIQGARHHPQIVQYAQETGVQWIDNDEVAWCSTFVNWCAMKANLPRSGQAYARSWLAVGKSVTVPSPGDVVIFWRESRQSWKGHVGLFMGFNHDASQVYCLGGNQNNAVNITTYDTQKVLGFRQLDQHIQFVIPSPVLRKGSKGQKVMQLQEILNFLGYPCGDPDGDFGFKTKMALQNLQADHRLSIDGVYGSQSKNIIETLLQQ